MLTLIAWLAMLLLVGTASGAEAHADAAADTAVTLQYLQLVIVSGATLLYAIGLYRIRKRLGPNRIVSRSQTFAFGAAAIIFILVLSPPVDDITDTLFSAHMAQHLVLMLIIPPLAVWSRPVVVGLWGFPHGGRKRISNSRIFRLFRRTTAWLMQPLVVAPLFLGAFCFWHLPRPYAWSEANEWVHAFEHLTFLLTAIMFWELVIEPSGRRRMGHLTSVLFVATIAALSALPGALMLFSPIALFKVYGSVSAVWGLSALEDQQIAGLIMWIPAGLFFLFPIAALFLKAMEDRDRLSSSSWDINKVPSPAPDLHGR